MSETPISPLRQRMTEDMTVRKPAAAAQRKYIRAVKTLSEFSAPATATPEVHQSAAGAQASLRSCDRRGTRASVDSRAGYADMVDQNTSFSAKRGATSLGEENLSDLRLGHPYPDAE
jgi:hypothetical protein